MRPTLVHQTLSSCDKKNNRQEPSAVAHTCKRSIWEVEARESRARGQPPDTFEVETSLGYQDPVLKISNQTHKETWDKKPKDTE